MTWGGRGWLSPFLVAALGGPTLTCSSHPSSGSARLWVEPCALAQPTLPFPAFCPGPISQSRVAQLLWCKEASLSVGNGLLGTQPASTRGLWS